MTSTRIIILHGSYGSPDGNWFPWLKSEMEQDGFTVSVPRFPTPEGQTLSRWLEVFAKEVGEINSNTILLGHSIGAGFALNLLERANAPIKATFLIAGFLGELGLPDYDPVNASFVSKDFNWSKIKRNAGELFLVAGDNDPYVPLEKGNDLSANLQIPLTLISNGGHLNAESGYVKFPWLKEQLVLMLPSKARSERA